MLDVVKAAFTASEVEIESTEIPSTDALSLPEDKQHEAMRMKLSGRTQMDIAKHFGVDLSTVYRWQKSYLEEYRKTTLESSTQFDLITDEIVRLNSIESEARLHAENCKSERVKTSSLSVALSAAQARQKLLLDAGLIQREPSKIFQVVADLKPQANVLQAEDTQEQSRDELIQEVLNKMQRAARL